MTEGPSMSPTAAPSQVSIGQRLDEAAVAVHGVSTARLLLYPLVGFMACFLLPARVSAAWLAMSLVAEAWLWFAGRAQFCNRAVGGLRRLNFAMSFAAINLAWLLLGILFWRTGSLAGQATATLLGLSVLSLVALLAYSSPVMFLVAGSVPAIGAMLMIGLGDGHSLLELTPVWGSSCLALIFILGRAQETPSAQTAQRQLKASFNQYRLLADNVTDVISRTDLDGAHVYVSPSSLAVLGYAPEELIGKKVTELVDLESIPELDRAVERMTANPGHVEVITTRFRRKDGRSIWLQSNAKLLLEDGVPVGGIHVSRDITARVEAERALRAAKLEAEDANRAKAEFLANMSHEIRTPMNGVLGALQLLERESISAEGAELMRHANACGRMLSQLLNDLLDFSRIEAGQLELSPEPTAPAEALRATIGLLEPEARAKGLDLRVEIDGEALWVEIDPLRLRQAMFNLLGNAIKFTSAGHVTARLSIAPTAQGDRRLHFEVSDTGVGIAAEAQACLFERFRQGEGSTARRFGGSGLGLSITRALVELMGGEVGFESRVGEGSTFWFELTLRSSQPIGAVEAEYGLLQGAKILLVEDNPTNRLVARTLLTRLGASVGEAEDGRVGLDAAQAGDFDLILMDVQMPNMDGVEATRRIRALDGPVAAVPIIGLTANVMADQQAAYFAAGMDGVVAKPLVIGVLLGEIERVLAGEKAALAS